MTFWVVRITTADGFRYGTYPAITGTGAEVAALRTYRGAITAEVMRQEGTMERQVREAFSHMYEGKQS